MGIYDRDYMKRRPDEDAGRKLAPRRNLDGLADRFLAKFPRLLPWLIVGILAAAVLLLLLNKMLH